MNEKSIGKLGGICAVIMGILYVLVGITYLLLPEAQKGGPEIEDLAKALLSINQNPTLLILQYVEFALIGILAFAAVPAISGLVQTVNEGWARWTKNLAYLGFAVVAISYFRAIALTPWRAAAFVAGDASTRAAIAGIGSVYIDPQGWLSFGAVGLWFLVVNVLALRGGKLPKVLGIIGIVGAISYGLVVAGNVTGIVLLVMIAAGLGGIIVAPIWFIWIGVRLLRTTYQAN